MVSIKNKLMIIVDSNAMAYRAFYTMGGLATKGDRTGTIFGFLHQLFKYAKKFKTSDFIFCWDSKDSLRRILYFKDYKKKRMDRRKELSEKELKVQIDAFRQFKELKDIVLPGLGFRNIFLRRGYESDDLVAAFAKKLKNKNIILANDNDLFQCISETTDYCNLKTGEILNLKSFEKQHGIIPEKWAAVKAIAGCGGDGVIGIKGIGEKKAIAYLTGKGKENDIRKINENIGIMLFNSQLVILPLNDSIKNLELKKNEFSREKFVDVFNRYAFKTFLDKSYFNKLEEVFFG